MENQRAHRKLVVAILVVATLLGLVSVLSIWVKRQALETDTWTNTSTKLLENKDVNEALSAYMVETLYENVDVEGELAGALPPPPTRLRDRPRRAFARSPGKLASEALTRPRVQDLWAEANRNAHGLFLELVEGGGDTLSTEGGDVTLDLGTIVERLGAQLGVDIADKLPADAAEIQLIESDQLSTAQDAVKALKGLSLILPLITLLLYGLAVYLARGWRREAVRAWGISWVLIGVLVLVIRSVAGEVLVGSLAKHGVGRTGGQRGLGHRHLAAAQRRHRDDLLRARDLPRRRPRRPARVREERPPLADAAPPRRASAYGAAAFIVLILLWWGPTEGFRRPLPCSCSSSCSRRDRGAARPGPARVPRGDLGDDARALGRWLARSRSPSAELAAAPAAAAEPSRTASGSSSASSPCATPAPSTPRSSSARSSACSASA